MKIVARATGVLLALSTACLAVPDKTFDFGSNEGFPIEGATAPPASGRPLFSDRRLWITAYAPDSESRSAIANLGMSIEEILGDRIGGIGTLRMAGELKTLGLKFSAIPLEEHFRPEDFPRQDIAYHNYERLVTHLKGLASTKGLASLFSIGQSLQGRDIWCLRLNTTESGTQRSSKPGIAFLGTHHAREHLSTEVPLLLAKHLIENRGKPEIAKLLASRDIYIIPMVNPDGVEYDVEDGKYRFQRKNMRDNGDGSLGVDLNRNYSYHWGEGGASPDPESDIYRGKAPFSEPETQAVKTFVEGRKDNLKILLSYHTFSELILYPWGHTHAPIEDDQALKAYVKMAKEMARMTGYKPEQSSDLYIASGDTTDWAWGAHKIFSFTFELTPKSMWGGGFYPGAGAIQTTLQNNIRPALYLMALADDPLRAASEEPGLSLMRVPSNIPTGGR
jgi:carboxypeptidase T